MQTAAHLLRQRTQTATPGQVVTAVTIAETVATMTATGEEEEDGATRAGGAGAPSRSRGGTVTPEQEVQEEADRERTTMTTTMIGAIEVRAPGLSSVCSPSCWC